MLLLGCAVSPEVGARGAAIVGGAPTTDHPAVAALVTRRRTCGELREVAHCTATLIAPDLALTAGHCVDGFGPRQLELVFGASLADPSATSRVVLRHELAPGYDEVSSDADLALLYLSAPLDVPPAPLSSEPLDASFEGSSVLLVGFGTADDGGTGVKRAGTATVSAVDGATFRYVPGPALSCDGDSGGPAFVDRGGELVLVGVTSQGDRACAELGVDTRVDVHLEAFLGPALEATRTRPAARVAAEAICASPCVVDDDCPGDLVCQVRESGEGRCFAPGTDPGDYGAPCATSDSCAPDAECRPFEDACRCHAPCPMAPPPGGGGGCAVAPNAERSASWGVALLLGLLARWRGRRGRAPARGRG